MTTIVVTGNARGGTTAVAGIVKRLGIPLPGATYHNENIALSELIYARHDPSLERYFREFDAEHETWAFKQPELDASPERGHAVLRLCREPRLIMVWRDPCAVAENYMREGQRPDRKFEVLLNGVLNMQAQRKEWIKSLTCPVLHISYEKVLIEPALQVERIAVFTGADGPRRGAIDSIKPGGYIE